MFERFTERARLVVKDAQDEARKRHHSEITTAHVLLALATAEDGLAMLVLADLGVTPDELSNLLPLPGGEVVTGQIPFTDECKKVLELSLREALSLGHNYVGTEHILLGIVRSHEGEGAKALESFGHDAETVRDTIIKKLSGPLRTGEHVRPPHPPLKAFALFKKMRKDGYIPVLFGGTVVMLTLRHSLDESHRQDVYTAEDLQSFVQEANEHGAEFTFNTETGPTFVFNP